MSDMEKLTIETSAGSEYLNIPTEDCDLTLGGFQGFTSLLPDEVEVKSRFDDLELQLSMVTEDGAGMSVMSSNIELDIAELNLQLIDIVSNQLRFVLPQSEHDVLGRVPVPNLFVLKESISIVSVQAVDPIIHFYHSESMAPDIEILKNELAKVKVWEIIKRRRIRSKINKLEKGFFVLVPVAEVDFASRMNTDFIRKQSPSIPQALKDKMAAEDIDEDKYMEWVEKMDWDSMTDMKEKNERAKLIAGYAAEFKKNIFGNAHKLISHICVPQGEKYNENLAGLRAKYFKTLSLDKAKAIINFFIQARKLLTLNT